MDIRNIAGVVAAAEFMNLTLAAKRLNITQSALSRQIQSLEAYLGVKLFEKVGRNDPCPCGSGKKYKKCCGAAA